MVSHIPPCLPTRIQAVFLNTLQQALRQHYLFFKCCLSVYPSVCTCHGLLVEVRGHLLKGWFSSSTLLLSQGFYCFCSCVCEVFSLYLLFHCRGFEAGTADCAHGAQFVVCVFWGLNSDGQSCVASVIYPWLVYSAHGTLGYPSFPYTHESIL